MINSLPTCYEVVSGRAKATAAAPRKRAADGAGGRPQQRQRVVSTAAAVVVWIGTCVTAAAVLLGAFQHRC